MTGIVCSRKRWLSSPERSWRGGSKPQSHKGMVCILDKAVVTPLSFPQRGPLVDISPKGENKGRCLLLEDVFVVHPVLVFPGLVFAGGMRRRFVDLEITSVELGPVQGGNDRPGGIIGHFHKAKAAALVSLLVQPDAGADHLGERFDELGQVGGGGGKRQVAKIQYFAHIPSGSMLAVYSVCAGCASGDRGDIGVD